MTTEQPLTEKAAAGSVFRVLERITAAALLLVLLALGWMIVMAFQPHQARLASTDQEVLVVVGLLLLALILVSLVALFHTDG